MGEGSDHDDSLVNHTDQAAVPESLPKSDKVGDAIGLHAEFPAAFGDTDLNMCYYSNQILNAAFIVFVL
jgi:hypothetical protein